MELKSNEPKASNNSQKKREIVSIPLKIPEQAEQYHRALKKYREEFNLPVDSSRKDFFLFVISHYLNESSISELTQQLETYSQKIILDTSSEEMQAFERATQRRIQAKASESRENFICQMFKYLKTQDFAEEHYLFD